MRLATTLIFLLLTNMAVDFAQPLDKKGTGIIKGRVTQNGKPASGITVVLKASTRRYSRDVPSDKVKTNIEGYYEFTSVNAGSYLVLPDAPIFVVRGASNSWDESKTINIAEGETIDGIDFSVERGGVVTGKVTNVDGRPLIGRSVRAERIRENGERGSYSSSFKFETDDRGIYRIYGLPAGRYRVSIGSRNSSFSSQRYPLTYYPSTTDENNATIVELTAGGEVSNIDIVVGNVEQKYKISGKIVYEDNGKPVPNAGLDITHVFKDGHSTSTFNSLIRSNSEGYFQVENLSNGRYSLVINMSDTSRFLDELLNRTEDSKNLYAEPLIFEINGSDKTDLEIKVRRGTILTGNIIVEGGNDPKILAQLYDLSVTAYKEIPREKGSDRLASSGSSQSSKIAANNSFKILGLSSGKYEISLSGLSRTKNKFHLLRVEHYGADKTDGIEVIEGQNVEGVRIVIGYGNSSLRGQVVSGDGSPISEGTQVFGSLRQLNQKTGKYRWIESIRPDVRGQFIIDGLMPGKYELQLFGNQGNAKQEINVVGSVTEVNVTLKKRERRNGR